MKNFSFADKELLCQQTFDQNGPYWHIATPGSSTEILFTNDEEYCFGMTLLAESAFVCGLKMYSCSLMSNHLHNLASARGKQQCIDFLDHYASRLKRFASNRGRTLDLNDFVCDPVPVTTLPSLRNNIVYIDRNAYVIYSAHTPYSYPWGSAFLYFGFNPALFPSTPFSSLSVKDKRNLLHSKGINLPDGFAVRNGFITPESFVDWRTGRSFFRDAHQYFNLLTKNREAYAEFAAIYGDRIVLTDEEMFSAAYAIAYGDFRAARLSDLSEAQKTAIARKMHFDYHAGNAQIHRILKLDKNLLQELFPEAR